jgi:cellulose synthase/poly-beta-1,6-N-acetylglucosamine synthase-like glycosyltransferase
MVTLESVYDPEFPKETPSNNPLVSVIIPTNQRPLKLCSALMAIADQKYSNFEVIVVYTPDSRTERVLDWFSSETPLELSYIEQRGAGVGKQEIWGLKRQMGTS